MKIWRRLAEADSVGLEGVSITTSPVFLPGEVELGQFTVVTGSHGAGKSFLLRALAASFPERTSLAPSGPPFERYYSTPDYTDVISGRHRIRYRSEDNRRAMWEVDLDQAPPARFSGYTWQHESPPPFAEYTDALTAFDTDYFWTLGKQRSPHEQTVIEEQKHTVGPFRYTAAEARVLRNITGRHYDDLRWYSYEAEIDLFVPRPEGIVGGQIVSADQMSRGELWVHLLLYMVRTARPGTTLFIDEPETHLSPVGHTALLDELARSTLARGVQTVIATHSTAMIARTPASMLRVLTPGPDGVRVIRPATTEAVLRTLGHRTSLSGVVFVEDALARRMVTAALARLDRSLGEKVDVVDAGGRDEALAGARILARSQALRVCVLLDGDQRGSAIRDRGFPVNFLPGRVPDEELLRQARADPTALGDLLGQSVNDINLAMDHVRFTSHQFWFSGAALHLGIDENTLVGHLIGLWLQNSGVEKEFRLLFAHVREEWSR